MISRTLVAVALVAGFASAAPVPTPPALSAEQAAEFDRLWDACGFHAGDRARLYLRLIDEPTAATAYLTAKLPPMAMTKEEAKKLLADLDSEDEKVWKRAYRALTVRDIRLAMTPMAAWELATGERQRERLGGLLFWRFSPDELPTGGVRYDLALMKKRLNEFEITERRGAADGDEVHYLPLWYAAHAKMESGFPPAVRARVAVAALERINTTAAKKHLEALAGGHEAGPATVEAKAALDRLKADPPKVNPPADLWKLDGEAWGKPEVLNQLLVQQKETVTILKDKLKPLTLTENEANRWQREEAAVWVLDAIGTDDALAVVKAMATGHKDAGPTKAAKEVLKRRGVK